MKLTRKKRRTPAEHTADPKPAHHKKRRYQRIALLVSLLLATIGMYALTLILPTVVYSPPKVIPKSIKQQKISENLLHIPKLGLSIPYTPGNASVLNEQAWHRFPERGDPIKGGNFILSAHRFHLGLTPGSTKRRSPFYHIDKLTKGDKLYVDFKGKRYTYQVTDYFSVQPTQTQIEKPSAEPKMTLYTCTLKGEADGREVVIAVPVGEFSP
jgi:sortase A